MKTQTALTVVAAVAATLFAQLSFAQTSAPESRAAVKADTKAANQSGALPPPGEQTQLDRTQTGKSVKTKAEEKADTKQAQKEGKITPVGEKIPPVAASGPKTSKMERKATTSAAVKNGGTVPVGENPEKK